MTDRFAHLPFAARIAPILSLLILASGLGGCASIGDSFASGAFVDPAKYAQYDCQQLEAERKAQSTRTAELQGLIDKAETGTAGTVVGVLAYRNDYVSARASANLVEETWKRNKCVASPVVVAPPVAAAPAPAPAKGARKRSGSAVD
jgi:hypothetical protein